MAVQPVVHVYGSQAILRSSCVTLQPMYILASFLQPVMGAVDPGGTLEMGLHISCPKVGLQLLTGEEWMALTPRVPGSPFHILEAGMRDVQLNLPAAGLLLNPQSPQRP